MKKQLILIEIVVYSTCHSSGCICFSVVIAKILGEYKHIKYIYIDRDKNEGDKFIGPFKCVIKTFSLILHCRRVERSVKKNQLPIITMNEVSHSKPDDFWVVNSGVVWDLIPLLLEDKHTRKNIDSMDVNNRILCDILDYLFRPCFFIFNKMLSDLILR